jgi:hypothetical protein
MLAMKENVWISRDFAHRIHNGQTSRRYASLSHIPVFAKLI